MRRVCLVLIGLALLLTAGAWAGMAYQVDTVTYLPIGELRKHFFMKQSYDAKTQLITLRLQNGRVVTLKTGGSAVTVAGKTVPLEAKILEFQGTGYVPAGAFTDALSITVTPADPFITISGNGGRVNDRQFPVNMVLAKITPAELALRQRPVPKTLGKAMMNAVAHNDTVTVEKLLKANPELNFIYDRDGNLPIHRACIMGLKVMVETLLANGASLEARGNYGSTPLMRVLGATNMTWGALPGSCDPDEIPFDQFMKIERQRVQPDEMVAFLLAKGADLNARNADGATALHFAASHDEGFWRVAEMLLNTNAEIEARDLRGRTPLHWAAEVDNVKVADLLLGKGASLESRDNDGDTPLHAAAGRFRMKMVMYLLNKGIDVNTRDDNGCTPFADTVACLEVGGNQQQAMLTLLLEKGADINIVDKSGHIPLSYCTYAPPGTNRDELSAQLSLVRFLLEHGQKVDGLAMRRACCGISVEMVALLLDNGGDVNVRDEGGNTPIYDAVQAQQVEIVKLLLARKADLTVQNIAGQTPLAWAKVVGNDTIVKLLTNAGAK